MMTKTTDELIQQLGLLKGQLGLLNAQKQEAELEKQKLIEKEARISSALVNKLANIDKEIRNLQALLAITGRKYATFLRYGR